MRLFLKLRNFLIYQNGKLKRLPLPAVLFLVILPVIFTGVYLSAREFNNQTKAAFARREALAALESLFIQEKFDGVVNIGVSLASRPAVYENIQKGSWNELTKDIESVLQTFPYIDSVTLFDKGGVLKATVPLAPEKVGESFAAHDYYQGISRGWRPYVSESFRHDTNQDHNVISVAVPVKSSDQKVVGFFLLTIKINLIIEWSKELGAGFDGVTYVVDKNGKLIAHPSIRSDDNLIDYSTVSVFQKLLHGEQGVEIIFNPVENEKQLIAYSPVKRYGLGVAVVQPTSAAFSVRSSKVAEYVMFWVLIVLVFSLSFYRILKNRVALIEQRDRERVLLESMGDGVVAIDRSWHISLWNKAASTITGWSKEEAMGKPFRAIVKFIRERDRKEEIAFIEDAIVMGRVSFMESGTLLIRKDESEIAVDDSVAPLLGQNGEVDGAIIVFRDASRTHESAHLRSDLAYATHQFRTPVTEAIWNLETAIDEKDPGKRGEDLRIVYQALQSVKKLSEHLVSVSEIDQGDISVKTSSVSLIDILTEVQKNLEPEAKKHDVKIFITPVSPMAAVNTDPKFLKKILYEVIENAVVYSPQGAEVIVATTFHKKEILIEVVDAGMGILEEQQPLIFTKFFRGANSGRRSAGSGLGLYLAKAYIMLLGGKIWFSSNDAKGTTFYLSLPLE